MLLFFRDEAASLRPPVVKEVEDEEMGMGKSKDKHKNKGKDKDIENPNGELFSIKLPQVVTVEVNQKTGKDSSVHLLVELSEETLDLRVPAGQGDRTALEEAERWKTLLLAWKDYSIDHGESLLHLDFLYLAILYFTLPSTAASIPPVTHFLLSPYLNFFCLHITLHHIASS